MTVTGFFSALVVGAIVGYLGRLLAPSRRPRGQVGFLLTITIGVVAALVGTAIATAVHQERFIAVFPIQVLTATLFVAVFRRLGR